MNQARLPLFVLLILGSLSLDGTPIHTTPVAQAATRPNIIFILTDDLDTRVFNRATRLQSLLTDQGTTLANNFVSLSLCCPSRSSILRGQYAHNTGIFTNKPPGGGFQTFFDLGRESSTVATWLTNAGYRTVLLGKYLNGYPGTAGPAYIPPGWSEWYGLVNGPDYFDYSLNENGRIVSYGSEPQDYLTDVLSRKANNFIRRSLATGDGKPFFMYVAPYAPHGPATPAARHASKFPDAQAPRTPSFNEEDMSDKPAWVQGNAVITAKQIGAIDALYRKRRQSMLAVEDLVDALIASLQDTGQLSNTYIFFSSDNGFHLGQHRLRQGKNTGFEEDLRVPLVVRGPGVPAGRVRHHLSVNIDLAPTFAELAGAAAPEFVDGRSLVPLIRTSPPPVESWRQAFLLEHGYPEEPDPAPAKPPVFQGLRTADRLTYIEYVTGERELYDLTADPNQLDNRYDAADPVLRARLEAWLTLLRACAGATCRSGESGPP